MRKILVVVSIILAIVCIQQLFLNMNQVVGNPPPPLTSNQLLLSEKVTYSFRNPLFGDVVVFQNNGNDFVGVVMFVGDNGDPKPYKVISKDGSSPWELAKRDIKARVWYPHYQMSYQDGLESK